MNVVVRGEGSPGDTATKERTVNLDQLLDLCASSNADHWVRLPEQSPMFLRNLPGRDRG